MGQENSTVLLIEQKIEKLQKKIKRNTIVFLVLLIAVIIHSAYTCVWTHEMTKPEMIVDALYGKVLLSTPEIGKNTRKYLIENAAVITDNVLDQSLGVLPQMRLLALRQADILTTKLFNEAIRDVEQVTRDMLTENKDKLREGIESGLKEENVSALSLKIVSEVEGSLDPWVDEMINSLEVNLESINNQLDQMDNKRRLTKEEQLEQRFIELWFQLMAKYFPEKKQL
ncbi:MAG: hypothetical protein ABII88_01015 [Candidatus Omnitrophota bacterium]